VPVVVVGHVGVRHMVLHLKKNKNIGLDSLLLANHLLSVLVSFYSYLF